MRRLGFALAMWCSYGCTDHAPPQPLPVADGGALVAAPDACGRSFCSAPLPSPGNSIALGDVDGDGRVDMLLGRFGTRLATLGPVTLLRGLGDMRFADVTVAAGLGGVAAWAMSFGDLDGDGDLDLVVGGQTSPSAPQTTTVRIFDNDGRGRFRERSQQPARGIEGAATSIQLADFDSDGRLDIVVGTGGTDRSRSYFDHIFIARPDGAFAPLAVPLDDPGFTWFVLPTDMNGDGREDFIVGNDTEAVEETDDFRGRVQCDGDGEVVHARESSWLSVVRRQSGDGDLRFELDQSLLELTAPGSTPMGGAAADFNRDGVIDYAFAQIMDQQLFLSQPDGSRVNEDMRAGLVTREMGTFAVAWGMVAVDIDRDQRIDLVTAFGAVPFSRTIAPNQVLMNRAGTVFEPLAVGHGLDIDGQWAALGTADLDGDGDTDFVLGAQGLFASVCLPPTTSARVVRNDVATPGRHWLRLRLRGTAANTEGIGARINVVVDGEHITREVSRGGATFTASDAEVDLGLGDLALVPELVVHWPGGVTQRVRDVAVDQAMTITQPRWVAVEPAVPTAGQEVMVRVSNEGLDAFAATPTLTVQGATWSVAPHGVGAATEASFRAGAVGAETRVAVDIAGSSVHALVRVMAR